MTSQPPPDGATPEGDDVPDQWEEVLRAVFGDDSQEALRELTERGMDPRAIAAAAGLPDDPRLLRQVFEQVKRMLDAAGDDPVNWEIAHDIAREVAVAEGDPSVGEHSRRQVIEAFSVAELWLDAATDLPPAGAPVRAWSRSEWVESTLPTWRSLADPVATSVADGLAAVLNRTDQAELTVPGVISPAMLRQIGGSLFGMQVGKAAGDLSREVFGATDIGLPLLRETAIVLLPTNVEAFGEGLEIPTDEVRLFLALREAAHARLFTHVTWLRGHLLGAVEAYARGIEVDPEAIETAVRDLDPSNPDGLKQALSEGVFLPRTTDAQRASLERLETSLALVEGWVDEVTATAAAPHLPNIAPLREMLRRRRAAGGPAEHTFATLVGLELRPRRSRDAAALWAQIGRTDGIQAREAVWAHPDLLPTAEDLDDPAGYAGRRSAIAADHAEVDRALAEILGEADGDESPDPGLEPPAEDS